jgi:virulence-associated protein VapD
MDGKNTVRQGIHFDMDTKALKKYYPADNWRKAYDDVRRYFEKNGFIHEQGSGYHSEKPMLQPKALRVVKSMIKAHPWLNKCVRICTIADVPATFDISYMFDKDEY